MLPGVVRLIAASSVREYWEHHPAARAPLERWVAQVKASEWQATADVQASFSKAKVLNAERVRFEVGGGDHRLIAAFDFRRGIVFVKFIGTHAEYDTIDALTISQF